MADPKDPRTPAAAGKTPGDRIAKLLARAGVASRREIERMIAEGRVALDGKVLDTPATVLTSLRGVTVDGQPVGSPEPTRLFLYHKPTGLLVTERDPKGRPTIYDRLPDDLPRLVPVGRLDLNTEGLLLLTTDGGFKRQLELPATGVERSYRARAYGNVTQQQLEELAEGVEIEGIRYSSIDANIERRTGANVWIEITITEGKNREVRRVLEYLGLQVSRLIRTRYGPFVLGDLPVGGIGEVKQHEIVGFRKTLKGGAPDEPIAAAPRAGFRTAPSVDRTTRTRRGAERGVERPATARPTTTGERPTRSRPRPEDGVERPAAARTSNPRSAATGEAPRPGFRTPATTDRAARTRTRNDARPREEKANVPTGGSAMKPWERADDRGGDRTADRNRSGDAPRFGRNKPDASRSGPRPPRGDGPARGGPAGGRGSSRPSNGRPPSGGFKGGPKGGPRGGRS
ncbi:pseudouridine synthase [Arthrobacter sp. TPD3018]|uniref:pseudouridine synthase n=1 Tax=Bacteria TaxID=2 RepID=UPI000D524BAF|nr:MULTISPECIES: pseudouridine synthase [Bacteria]PVE59794.1 pseudouridine synthase [Sphingomonas sp. TPD3009]PVE61312.1 pseudouridine synthase [Arthrobacter sp. TPD3018]PVE85769.1 pseudouridine synthase [Sphingomonas melonis]